MTATRGSLSPRRLAAIASVVALVVLLLWMQGTLGGHRVGPDDEVAPVGRTVPAGAARAEVTVTTMDRVVEVPGSIRSRTEFSLAPRIQAAILEVLPRPGASVKKGDVLVRLDDRDLRARVAQAQAALDAATADSERAAKDLSRTERLLEERAATAQQADQVRAGARAAAATVERARRALDEARVFLDETQLVAPHDAVVAERRVEPGDMALPGQPLLVLYGPEALRLEAPVEESLARGIGLGDVLGVAVPGVDAPLDATVEVVPAADPRTRTVLVKAALPPDSGLRPGGFGRLRVPAGQEDVLRVPAAAIRHVGQLTFAEVVRDGRALDVSVRLGRTFRDGGDTWLEVLAGLRPGETVLLTPSAAREGEP